MYSDTPESLKEIRICLNHISGFSYVLRSDARLLQCGELSEPFRIIAAEAEEIKHILVYSLCADSDEDMQTVIREEIARHLYIILIQLVKLENVFQPDKHARFEPLIREVRGASYELARLFEKTLDISSDTAFALSEEEAEKLSVTAYNEASLSAENRNESSANTILFADIPADVEKRLREFAIREGYTLISPDPGEKICDYLREHTAFLAIIGVGAVPDASISLLEQIKKDAALYELPVFMMGSLEDSDVILKCIAGGAIDFFPFDYADVLFQARVSACAAMNEKNVERLLYTKALEETKRRLQKELAAGARYVANMLPPPLSTNHLSIDWIFIPSIALGGDVFGYHWLSSAVLAAYLIDVSGHGIEASLLAVTVMNLLKNSVLKNADFYNPASVLTALNQTFKIEEQNNMYFTAWYGIYNVETRMLTYASAGSQPAIFFPPDSPSENLSTHGLIIGLDPSAVYENRQRFVSPNSRLYIFSDGIFELRKKDKEMMNLQEFTEILGLYVRSEDTPRELAKRITAMSYQKKFEDDVSFLEFHFNE